MRARKLVMAALFTAAGVTTTVGTLAVTGSLAAAKGGHHVSPPVSKPVHGHGHGH